MTQIDPIELIRALGKSPNHKLRALVCREALALVNANESGLFIERELSVPLRALDGFTAEVGEKRGSVNVLLFSRLSAPEEIARDPFVIPWEGRVGPGAIMTADDKLHFVVQPSPVGVSVWIASI